MRVSGQMKFHNDKGNSRMVCHITGICQSFCLSYFHMPLKQDVGSMLDLDKMLAFNHCRLYRNDVVMQWERRLCWHETSESILVTWWPPETASATSFIVEARQLSFTRATLACSSWQRLRPSFHLRVSGVCKVLLSIVVLFFVVTCYKRAVDIDGYWFGWE